MTFRSSELDTCLQEPLAGAPAIGKLGGGTIRRDAKGQLIRATGRHTVVYELRTPAGRILVLRVHQRPDRERDRALAQRYQALQRDTLLDPLRAPQGPLPDNIQWLPEGLLVRSSEGMTVALPLVAMERLSGWVPTLTIVPGVGFAGPANLAADGTLWAWGDNTSGQLGIGSTVSSSTPTQVGTANDWVMVSAGADHSIGIRADGSLWGWGFNGSGRLGDGTATTHLSPVRSGTATDWTFVAAGGSSNLGIRSDGSLWVWGFNGQGQLGDGTLIEKWVPTRIGADHTWVSGGVGAWHAVALASDGSLWGWGINMREGDINTQHVHPNAKASGCYYISMPPATQKPRNPLKPDGAFIFTDPRPRANMNRVPGQATDITIPPKPGQMLLFPSYYEHFVLPFRGQGVRQCIAFNLQIGGTES